MLNSPLQPMPQSEHSVHSSTASSTTNPHPTPNPLSPPPSHVTSQLPPSDPDTSLPVQQEVEAKNRRKKSKLTSSLPLSDNSTQPLGTTFSERPPTRREQRFSSPPQPGELEESGGQKLTSSPQGGELGEAEWQRLTSLPQPGELEDSGDQILMNPPQTGEPKSRKKRREQKGAEELKEIVTDHDGGGSLQHVR